MVDCGSTTAISAIRSRKKSCSATNASSSRRGSGRASGRARRSSRVDPLRAARPAPRRVGGRTPRQKRKASAACSTSMPSPSRADRAVAARPGEEAGAAGPYIMSSASAPGRSTRGRRPAPRRRRGCWRVALTTTSKPGRHRPAQRRRSTVAVLRRPAAAWRCDQRRRRLVSVRLATTSSAGPASSSGPSTPAAPPPAPISSTSRAAQRRRRRCATMSAHQADAVGVVAGPAVGVEAQRSCRPAPARRAACARLASATASNLNGTVTLQPAPPPAREARARRRRSRRAAPGAGRSSAPGRSARANAHGSTATGCARPGCRIDAVAVHRRQLASAAARSACVSSVSSRVKREARGDHELVGLACASPSLKRPKAPLRATMATARRSSTFDARAAHDLGARGPGRRSRRSRIMVSSP